MTAPVLFRELPTADGKAIGIATLNVEKALNALSLEMIDLLDTQLAQWQQDARIVCVLLEGAGEKAFCAGGDVRRLYQSIRETAPGVRNTYAEGFFSHEYRLDYRIHSFGKPLICWGHGIVMGGGIGLMMGASHRVVTEASRLAMPEITIGLYPDVGGSFFLNRCSGRIGLFLGLTGVHINAADARFAGLADRFLKHADKAAVIASLQDQRWPSNAEDANALVGGLLRQFETVRLPELPASKLREHADTINALLDVESCAAAVHALLGQADSDDAWLAKAVATLKRGCPVTAHLVWEQLRHGYDLSLREVFQMEFMLSMQCSYHEDFAEGVRALLIDKDNAPQWKFRDVTTVPRAWIDEFFTPCWEGAHPLADL